MGVNERNGISRGELEGVSGPDPPCEIVLHKNGFKCVIMLIIIIINNNVKCVKCVISRFFRVVS